MSKWPCRNGIYQGRVVSAFAAVLIGVVAVITGCVAVTGSGDDTYTGSFVAPAPLEYMRVSVIGDGYAAGIGADRGKAWPNVIGNQMCWSMTISGEAGTGYLAAGSRPEYSAFGARVPDVVQSSPALVIVQGGDSDLGRSDLEDVAGSVLRELKSRVAGRIVVVGPIGHPLADLSQVGVARESIRQASISASVDFFDPIELGWIGSRDSYAEDGMNLNTTGAREFATGLRAALEDLDIENLYSCGSPR